MKQSGWRCLSAEEPADFEDANTMECRLQAMMKELGSINDNNAWELVDLHYKNHVNT